MIFIELKIKPITLVLRIFSALLAAVALVLVIISIIFAVGGDAPSIFGSNVYIVRTDSFNLIKKGDAVVTSAVPFDEILTGNIIIYQNSEKQQGIAEIHSSELNDGVYSFTAVSEQGKEIKLTQSQILGKAMQFSGFLGALISFAKSPAGVFVIAVLPCVSILIYEAVQVILKRFVKEKGGKVVPVKKQDEVPTFIPRQKVNAAISTYSSTAKRTSESTSLAEKKRTEVLTDEYPFFSLPNQRNTKTPPQNTYSSQASKKSNAYPLSQKRLNEVIAETNARKNAISSSSRQPQNIAAVPPPPAAENNNEVKSESVIHTAELPDVSRAAIGKTATLSETVKRYIPKKSSPRTSSAAANTSSLPRLDRLLNDDSDSENTRYDIGAILSSLEKR